jgi:hypothetical protein
LILTSALAISDYQLVTNLLFKQKRAVLGGLAEFFVNPQKLVVFANPVCPAR